MSGFSDGGEWWWDGQAWIATSQVIIPDLHIPPPPALNQSMANRQQLGDASNVGEVAYLATQKGDPILLPLTVWFLLSENRAFKDFREWSLQQVAAATTYLLGPGEPMVAGETSLIGRSTLNFSFVPGVRRDLAIAVTAAHVLILMFDTDGSQPRRVALAARPSDVRVDAPTPIFARPLVVVQRGAYRWWIRGQARVMQPKPVVAAWRAALAAGVRA